MAKVESSSTFRNKICTCYAFSQPSTNLFCNYSYVSQHLFLKWKVVEIMWRHTSFLLDTWNGERSPLASGNLSDEKKEVLMKQLRFVSECRRFYIIILFLCFKILRRSCCKSQLGHFRVIKYLPFKTKSSEKYFGYQTFFTRERVDASVSAATDWTETRNRAWEVSSIVEFNSVCNHLQILNICLITSN